MSFFENLLWPIIFVFRLTGVLPLTNQFAPSRRGQNLASFIVILSVTLGCVKPYQNIIRSSFKPEDFMQITGVLLTILSAMVSFFTINFRIKEASDLFNKLQLVHDNLNVGVNFRLMISVWVPFVVIYLIPLLYKVFNMVYLFKTFPGLLLDVCNATRFNYLNSSVLTFVITCLIMGAYYKEILKQLKIVSLSNDLCKKSRLEILKNCHLNLFESVEMVKSLYGIHILFGLVTSNMYFQMSVFKTLHKWINTNDSGTMPSKFISTFIFLSLDIGRIIFCFTSSNAVCKQVEVQKIF